MNSANGGLLAVFVLLYSASFWGLVWFPARWLEQQGLVGLWQALVSYGAAFLLLSLLRGCRWSGVRQSPWAAIALVLAAGWTNVAFLLAVISDEVVRVLILFYLSPLWSILLGRWLLGEVIRPATGAMLALGLGGALIMLWHPDMLSKPLGQGDTLALTAGMAFALNNVLTRRLSHLGTVAKTQLAWVGVILVVVVWLALAGEPLPQAPAQAWGGAVLLGVLGFMFSTLAVIYAVSRMPVQRSAVIMLFEIIVGAISAWALANEGISMREWIGGVLIIVAGLVAVMRVPDHPPPLMPQTKSKSRETEGES